MPFGVWTRVQIQETMGWIGSSSPRVKGQFSGVKGAARDMPRYIRRSMYAKRLSRGQNRYGADADRGVLDGCTMAPSGEYDRSVRVRRRCDLMSNYCDHLIYSIRCGTGNGVIAADPHCCSGCDRM